MILRLTQKQYVPTVATAQAKTAHGAWVHPVLRPAPGWEACPQSTWSQPLQHLLSASCGGAVLQAFMVSFGGGYTSGRLDSAFSYVFMENLHFTFGPGPITRLLPTLFILGDLLMELFIYPIYKSFIYFIYIFFAG